MGVVKQKTATPDPDWPSDSESSDSQQVVVREYLKEKQNNEVIIKDSLTKQINDRVDALCSKNKTNQTKKETREEISARTEKEKKDNEKAEKKFGLNERMTDRE